VGGGDGDREGFRVGSEGAGEGILDGDREGPIDGEGVGAADGVFVGAADGAAEGDPVGAAEGGDVGASDGAADGDDDGTPVGVLDGAALGVLDGLRDGILVGDTEGVFVGAGVTGVGSGVAHSDSTVKALITSDWPRSLPATYILMPSPVGNALNAHCWTKPAEYAALSKVTVRVSVAGSLRRVHVMGKALPCDSSTGSMLFQFAHVPAAMSQPLSWVGRLAMFPKPFCWPWAAAAQFG